MATLVLTAVGTVLGGPIGGAIGAIIGQAVDQNILFKPKGREGPRLNELQVQTSTYGSQVPQIFGTMRVAGTVIWATDLREARTKSGGGKGRPSTTSFSYSASFAVALSSRPVQRVGRIWADGNLLRGAAGDFKTELGAFRLLTGAQDQMADPLIASAQGIGMTPAHRGFACAVFEDLQLADYGNRIPSLTFELFADEDSIAVGAIAAALTGGAVTGDSAVTVDGYAASGADIAAGLAPLVDSFGLRVRSDAGVVRLEDGQVPVAALNSGDVLARLNGRAVTAMRTVRDPAESVPRVHAVRHHDPARDYQAGLQKAVRPGPGRREVQADIPAVLTGEQARAIAQQRLHADWKARDRIEMTCGWSALLAPAGSVVAVAGQSGVWAVDGSEWESMGVSLVLRRVGVAGVAGGSVSSGTAVTAPDLAHGPTQLVLADLPPLGDVLATAPVVVAAAAGGEGWRKAALFSLVPGSGEAAAMGQSAPRAIMGVVAAPIGNAGHADMFDMQNVMHVILAAPDMVLSPADDAALARGANLCLLGREMLQFGAVTQIGPSTYRLQRLLRGRRGTEWAMGSHGADERLVMLDPDTWVQVPDAAVRVGDTLEVLAIGIGDSVPASASLAVTGEAMRPPAPVHARIGPDGAGGFHLGWTRRSRLGWQWVDGIDAPLGEEQESYIVRVFAGESLIREVSLSAQAWTYTAAMISADGGSATHLEICQAGTFRQGRPCTVIVPH